MRVSQSHRNARNERKKEVEEKGRKKNEKPNQARTFFLDVDMPGRNAEQNMIKTKPKWGAWISKRCMYFPSCMRAHPSCLMLPVCTLTTTHMSPLPFPFLAFPYGLKRRWGIKRKKKQILVPFAPLSDGVKSILRSALCPPFNFQLRARCINESMIRKQKGNRKRNDPDQDQRRRHRRREKKR